MAEPAPKPETANVRRTIANDGAIPRMGINLPMPASTKPPPRPSASKASA